MESRNCRGTGAPNGWPILSQADAQQTNFATIYAPNLLSYAVTLLPQSKSDWYSINVTDTRRALDLQTSTPADGPGEFTNGLDPQIELYDPDGKLIATGAALADGRNESINYQPLIAGTYRIRVSAASNTNGDYVLRVRTPILGDVNQDGLLSAADLTSFVGALADLNAFATQNNLATSDLLAIGVVNRDGAISNADLQPLINLLTVGAGASSDSAENTGSLGSRQLTTRDVARDTRAAQTAASSDESSIETVVANDSNATRSGHYPIDFDAGNPNAVHSVSAIPSPSISDFISEDLAVPLEPFDHAMEHDWLVIEQRTPYIRDASLGRLQVFEPSFTAAHANSDIASEPFRSSFGVAARDVQSLHGADDFYEELGQYWSDDHDVRTLIASVHWVLKSDKR